MPDMEDENSIADVDAFIVDEVATVELSGSCTSLSYMNNNIISCSDNGLVMLFTLEYNSISNKSSSSVNIVPGNFRCKLFIVLYFN